MVDVAGIERRGPRWRWAGHGVGSDRGRYPRAYLGETLHRFRAVAEADPDAIHGTADREWWKVAMVWACGLPLVSVSTALRDSAAALGSRGGAGEATGMRWLWAGCQRLVGWVRWVVVRRWLFRGVRVDRPPGVVWASRGLVWLPAMGVILLSCDSTFDPLSLGFYFSKSNNLLSAMVTGSMILGGFVGMLAGFVFREKITGRDYGAGQWQRPGDKQFVSDLEGFVRWLMLPALTGIAGAILTPAITGAIVAFIAGASALTVVVVAGIVLAGLYRVYQREALS